MDMKLNKYIYEKLEEKQIRFLENESITEEDIDEWITDWYNDTFKELGKPDAPDKPRGPPMWLAGKNWVERAKDRANAKNEEV
tara:strand:+ start:192 stop:440 length:249 start_codon:yes stop_codon:yes gene_type:complete